LSRYINREQSLYSAQGLYAEAEPLYKRSLTIVETALGPDHSDVGKSLKNLAVLYKHLGSVEDEKALRTRLARMPPAGTRHVALYFVTNRSFGVDGKFTGSLSNSVALGRAVMLVPKQK